MTRPRETLGADYFEDLYAGDPDPWRFATSAYEAQKYAATLAALPCSRYRAALEVGCSIGVLTDALAEQCETLVAVDAADSALLQARDRCRSHAQVAFACAFVPVDWPDGIYDLVLLSEVIYYLGRDDVDRLASRVRGSTRPGADIVLVHWLGLTDYPLSGDEAADWFIRCSAPFARVIHEYRTERYRIDVLRVGSGPVRE